MYGPSMTPTPLAKLAKQFESPRFRHAYLASHIRAFLSTQIRALRNYESQIQFGKKIDKPQSVVSRLENQGTSVNVQTLIDIANKLDVGLVVRFVDYPTLLKWTDDFSAEAIAPSAYQQTAIDNLIIEEQWRKGTSALDAFAMKPQFGLKREENKAGANLGNVPGSPANSSVQDAPRSLAEHETSDSQPLPQIMERAA